MEKTSGFQKNIYFCFIDYAKAFDCVDCKKLWKILQEMGLASWEICMQVKKQQLELNMDNGLVPNWGRSSTSLYIFILFI